MEAWDGDRYLQLPIVNDNNIDRSSSIIIFDMLFMNSVPVIFPETILWMQVLELPKAKVGPISTMNVFTVDAVLSWIYLYRSIWKRQN